MDDDRLTNASISTMWAINNYPDLNDFFKVAISMGFQMVELNHQVGTGMLAQVNFDHHKLSSIHEPCPADISTKERVDRDWLISATLEENRTRGVQAVKKSVDLAKKLAAPVVVMHCGTVPFALNHESKLRSLLKAGKEATEEFHLIKAEFEQHRQNLVRPRLQAVQNSLAELLEYAGEAHIKIGLENRYHYMDIPSIDEMEELLGLADSTSLGFIYDVGHAQALDRLGFYPHDEWLIRFSSRMIGCHLHDVIGLTDHYAPGLGEIDFNHIAKYLPERAFRTVEILPGNTLAQVSNGIKILAQVGCIRYL